jgi:hypothetical protein
MAEHAVKWAKKGFKLVPLRPDTRTPYIREYHDTASSEELWVRRWWTSWPDALIGCVLDEDAIILDVDPKHNGMSTWEALGGDDIDVFRRHFSGRNDGGHHNWFLKPEIPEGKRLRITGLNKWAETVGVGEATGDVGWTSGIDLLTSRHRYTILPPSPHPVNGKPYFLDEERRGKPGELPKHIAALLLEDVKAPSVKIEALPSSVVQGETPADWVSRTMTWAEILEPHGWNCVWGDGEEDGSLWRHPTATASSSASITHGLLFVYSPNTPFDTTQPGDPTGYTPFRAWALLDHNDDQSEAALEARVRMNKIQGMPERPPEGINPDTGEVTALNLPAEFWEARPFLRHVRQAAHARMASADAILGALLARYAICVPTEFSIPPIVMAPSTFDHLTCLASHSSGGKSGAMSISRELFPELPRKDIVWHAPNPTGEGLVASFYEWVTEEDGGGKKERKFKKTKKAVLFASDEGMALVQASKRESSTISSVLCTAWSGGNPGQTNASQDRNRPDLTPGTFRIAGITAIQYELGHHLLTDELARQGFSGRVTFFAATDPTIPRKKPEWPGPLELPVHPSTKRPIEYPQEVCDYIEEQHWTKATGDRFEAPIDGHSRLSRLKIAGLLAMMDNRLCVDMDDWGLATTIVETSTRIRSHMKALEAAQHEAAATSRAHSQARHQIGVGEELERHESQRIDKMADTFSRHLTEADGRLSLGYLRRKMKASLRGEFEVVIERCVERGLFEVIDDEAVQ